MQRNTRESGHSSFWAKHLEGASCLFPVLAGDVAEDSQNRPELKHRTQPTIFPLDSVRHDYDGIENFHCAAWSILLQRYVGDKQACFAVFETSDDATLVSVCNVNLSKADTASAVIVSCRESLEACRPYTQCSVSGLFHQIGPGQRSFNTAVHLNYDATMGNAGDFSEFQLTLQLQKTTNGMELCIKASPDFPTAAAAMVTATYQTIISKLAQSVHSPLSEMHFLSQGDLDKTMEWNQTCPEPVDGLVQDFLLRKVLSHPNEPAICASDGSFTYQELDKISNVLANFLVTKGVGPEVVVPLCHEKSAWASLTMVAVTKAGGAFTFLDASYPIARLEGIIRQVNAKFVLCSSSELDMGQGLLPAFEVSKATVAKMPQLYNAPFSSVKPWNLLYVIFTSGSTGQPKGVCVEHSNYLSSALNLIQINGMDAKSRVLQFASYNFDASILENFTTLIAGGCVCVPGEASRNQGISHVINEFESTWALLTPSLVKLMDPRDVPTLKTLALGGEPLSNADIKNWAGEVQLQNMYGPTECSIVASGHPQVSPGTAAGNIGWPIGGLLWVVDANDHNQLVPILGIGELAIEGPHLARCYLNDPETTSKVFVESPKWMEHFPSSRRRRLYLTGDLVRRNTDGSIHFVGRRDTQVKIRGLRIELLDIEHHISAVSSVDLAVVVAPSKGVCKKRLVAIITLQGLNTDVPTGSLEVLKTIREKVQGTVIDIRDNVRKKLPGYMVPPTWIVLESFPLMPSGKTDRVKIATWIEGMNAHMLSGSECILDRPHLEVPVTLAPKQKQTASRLILSNFPLLKTDQDNFNHLMNSILPEFDISPENIEDIYSTSPMQTGMLLSQAKNENLYQTVLGFKVESTLPFEVVDVERLINAWRMLVSRHSALRTIFVPGVAQESFQQVALRKADIRVARIRCTLSKLDSILRERHIIPVYDRQPAHKFTVCECESGETWIRLDHNHALGDGVALAAMIRDLTTLYDCKKQLPPVAPYSEFIAHVQNCDSDESLRYWAGYVHGIEPCNIPFLCDSFVQDGSSEKVKVQHELPFQTLTRFCKEHTITFSTFFKAVWAIVLQTYTGRDDVTFGYIVSNRRNLAVTAAQDIVGPFINILICRIDTSRSFASLLSSVQQDSVSARDHTYTSLAKISKIVGSKGSTLPLFNTLLNIVVGKPEKRDSTITFSLQYKYDPTEFGLGVDVSITGEDIEISLLPRTPLVSGPQVRNVAATFALALSRILEVTPDTQAKSIHLLSHDTLIIGSNDDCRHSMSNNKNEENGQRPESKIISMETELLYDELNPMLPRLSAIIAKILDLNVDQLWLDRSFIGLGGDSITAMQVVALCQKEKITVKIKDVLQSNNIAELAELAEHSTSGSIRDTKDVYEPFSSRGAWEPPAFLKNAVCIQLETSESNIEDVVEATDLQSKALCGRLGDGRGFDVYLTFQLSVASGVLNRELLEKACYKLVSKHSILRTKFIAYKRHVFQVVLRSFIPAFKTKNCENWQQLQLAAEIVESDKIEAATLTQPLVRFEFLDSGKEGMLLMRLSHAQYDGMSMRMLIGDLKKLYEGEHSTKSPMFSKFVHASLECNKMGATEHWQTLLEGSSMTNVILHKTPPYKNEKGKVISKEITAPQRLSKNITFATILKAAWALVLAEMSSSTDVVFGETISGRNLSVPGVDVTEIVGPCLNYIPVRVRLGIASGSGARTVGELLRQVLHQRLSAIPFETFGLDKIVESCAGWPLWTRFGTQVQHRYLGDSSIEEMAAESGFGDGHSRIFAFSNPPNNVDVRVLSVPKNGGSHIQLALEFRDKVAPDFATQLLDHLVTNIELLTAPEIDIETALLPDIESWTTAAARIPLHNEKHASIDRTATAMAAGFCFDNFPEQIMHVVAQAWNYILEPAAPDKVAPQQEESLYQPHDQNALPNEKLVIKRRGQISPINENAIAPTTPFYDVWGNLIAAAQFAEFYAAHAHVQVTVEEMIENPSMLTQAMLLAERMGIKI